MSIDYILAPAALADIDEIAGFHAFVGRQLDLQRTGVFKGFVDFFDHLREFVFAAAVRLEELELCCFADHQAKCAAGHIGNGSFFGALFRDAESLERWFETRHRRQRRLDAEIIGL